MAHAPYSSSPPPRVPFSRRPAPGAAGQGSPPFCLSVAPTVEQALSWKRRCSRFRASLQATRGAWGTLSGAGRPSGGLRALLSAPPFLRNHGRPGARDTAAAPRPLTRLPSGLFLWVRPPSPVASASAARGAGVRERPAWARWVPGAATSRRQAAGVRSRPEWAAVSHSPAHTLAAAGSCRRSSPGGRREETPSWRGRVNAEVLEPATPQATVETVGIRTIRPPKAS